MQKADAILTFELWVYDKDEDRRIYVPTTTKIVPTELLLGDGNAEAWREFSMVIKGGDFNAITLGTTAGVRIRCNQDDASIANALVVCQKIAKMAIRKYEPKMKVLLTELVKERE